MTAPGDGLPPMPPNPKAFAERCVLSIKSECLERMLPLRRGHLPQAIWDYIAHYYSEQDNQDPGQGPDRWGSA